MIKVLKAIRRTTQTLFVLCLLIHIVVGASQLKVSIPPPQKTSPTNTNSIDKKKMLGTQDVAMSQFS